MLQREFEHRIMWRRHDLDGKDMGVKDVGPCLLLSTKQASQNVRIVDANAVDHRAVIGAQAETMVDGAQGKEAIVY